MSNILQRFKVHFLLPLVQLTWDRSPRESEAGPSLSAVDTAPPTAADENGSLTLTPTGPYTRIGGAWDPVITAGGLSGTTGAAAVGYDNSTSGLVATDLQAAVDELDGVIDGLDASAVAYDNSTSSLAATDAQGAIDELDGVLDDLQSDATGAGLSMIGFEDAGALFAALDPEAALQEVRTTLLVKNTTDLVIASGEITVTQSYHRVDTEAAAASDDLTSILGMQTGGVYVFRNTDPARSVVFKHGLGNIRCLHSGDVTLSAPTDLALVFWTGASAVVLAVKTETWGNEGISRSLVSNASGLGASLVGTEDAGGYFSGADVESNLQALGASRAALNAGIGYALVTASDAVGGSTSSTVTVKLYDLQGNAIAKAADLQISGISGTCTWGAAAKGSVLGSGTTSQIRTDANGEFEAILDNSADETLYLYTLSTPMCALVNAIVISPSPADAVTWSA